MSRSASAVRKKGYLHKLPVKGLVKKWSRRWFVLYATSHEGVVRMEYFDNESCEKSGIGKRTIPLRDSSGIKQSIGDKTHPYVFELQSQLGFHKFACDTQPELDEWVEGMQEALREDKMKRRQKKTQSLVINREEGVDYDGGGTLSRNTSTSSYSSEINEGTYRVNMEQNETAEKMALQGEYNLVVSSTSLSLVSASSGATIAEWHFKFLKNYGKQHGVFQFETGKASPTGAGRFVCVTTCSKEIFGVVSRNIRRLREAKESEKKASQGKQVEEAQPKIQAERRAAPVKKQGSLDNGGQRSDRSKRSSREVAGQPVAGSYRSSRDVEELTAGDSPATAQQVTAPEDEFDPSHLYTAVNKTKKPSTTEEPEDPSHLYTSVNKTKKQSATGPPPKPQPYSPTRATDSSDTPQTSEPSSTDPFQAPADAGTNRHSYGSVRDSRDSALVQLDYLGSFDETEEENLAPITTGVSNPMGEEESFTVPEKTEDLINFNLDDLDKNFFDQLDQLNNIGATATGALSGASGGMQFPPPDTPLDQQQFGQIWSSIFSDGVPSLDQTQF